MLTYKSWVLILMLRKIVMIHEAASKYKQIIRSYIKNRRRLEGKGDKVMEE